MDQRGPLDHQALLASQAVTVNAVHEAKLVQMGTVVYQVPRDQLDRPDLLARQV